MSWFSDVFDAVVNVVSEAVGAVADAIARITDALAIVGFAVSDFINQVSLAVEDALGGILPEEVAKWVTLNWFLIETATAYGAGFLQNLGNAVRTGKLLEIFDVVTPAVVVAIRNARNQARTSAVAFPHNVLSLIPDKVERDYIAEVARFTTVANIDDKRFFFVWRRFKGNTAAITLMDTVVYSDTPNFQNYDDQFLALHEIRHVLQFRVLGVDQFIRDYLQEKITSGDVPSFEREADEYACSVMPLGHPHYIGSCPTVHP